MRFCKVQLVLVSTLVGYTLGDPTDWVSVEYVIMKGQPASRATGKSLTSDAEATIVRNADSTGTKGPYSIVNSKDVLPPSKDPHDYLSWAPYHWPDCNWCANKQKRLAYAPDTSKNGTYDDNSGKLHSNLDELEHGHSAGDQIRFMPFPAVLDVDSTRRDDSGNLNPPDSTKSATTNLPGDVAAPISLQIPTATSSTPKTTSSLPDSTGVQPSQTPIQDGHRPGPAQAAKTTKCTPSPTKSLAPSATWTTCPYVVRDGDVNPDVRTLNGPDAINSLSQNVLFQALASILSKDGSSYAKTAAAWIDAFFITASTKMNPNLNFGQIVRGPGPDGQKGTFTGVLDLRGMVKVCNAIQLLKAGGSSVWTKVRDDAMSAWLSKYSKWLDTSEIGQKAASRPNNHGTFFVNQVVSPE